MSFRPTEPQGDAPAGDEEEIDFIGARVFEVVTIPRTNYKGRMRVVSRAETFRIKTEARKYFTDEKMPLDNHAAFGAEEWSNEIAIRTLAVAIRNPRDVTLELAPLAEFRDLDDDQVDKLWIDYRDFRAQVDPLGFGELSDADFAAMVAAAKKKQPELLIGFGSSKLVLFAMRLAEPPTS